MLKVTIVGAGGVGGWIADPLARWLNWTYPDKSRLLLVDGDTFSDGNFARQNMKISDISVNKAEAMSNTLQAKYPSVDIVFLDKFLDKSNIDSVVEEGDYIFSCVDNYATRKLISDKCNSLKDISFISTGNEETDGNVQVFVKRAGAKLTNTIDEFHDEIKNPTDKNPADLSCLERAQLPSSTQIIFTNFAAASVAINNFYRLVVKPPVAVGDIHEEVYFDILTSAAAPSKRKVKN